MEAKVIKREGNKITYQITVEHEGSMLDMEEKIQQAVNSLGMVATEETISGFDTNGEPIKVLDIVHTSKGQTKKIQTPYGTIEVTRHVYQSSRGGKLYVPMDAGSRLLSGATPRFAKILGSKYAQMSAEGVERDLEENHGRKISSHYVQKVFV